MFLYIFNVGSWGLALGAAITSGLIAGICTFGTWDTPDEADTFGLIGFSALVTTIAIAGGWFWLQSKIIIADMCFAVSIALTVIFVRQAQKFWAKESFTELFATALPNAGVILGAIIGFIILITKPPKDMY